MFCPYGFNGMEKDDEVKGVGNSYTTMFRQYDPRVARWLSIDPKSTAWESPYVSMGNNPLLYTDALGDTIVISLDGPLKEGSNFDLANKLMVTNSDNDGVFILSGHADPQGIENWSNENPGDNGFVTTPEEIFSILEKNKDWNQAVKDGLSITLILDACNAATDPKDYWTEGTEEVEKSIALRMSEYKPEITIVAADGSTCSGPILVKEPGVVGTLGKFGITGINKRPDPNTGLDIGKGGWLTLKGGVEIKPKQVVGNPRFIPSSPNPLNLPRRIPFDIYNQ